MAVLKCNVCGGELQINEDRSIGVCKYCGATITIPKNLDRRGNLYNRAVFLRQNNEFDKAAAVYEEILREDNADAEAHWGLALCKYGIEYVSDPGTGERMPTCHRTQAISILSDPDYRKAVELSDFDAKNVIESEAARISEIQAKILELARREPPYDIFICYKESDESGSRTEDSVIAQDLYYELIKKGYKVFYARKTLEKRLGTEYEPIIFAALDSAKVMVVLGTKPEHFQSVWVRNEWNRFLKMSADSPKTIIPAYKGMSPYELPTELSALQSQDMSRIGFLQELLDGIDRCLQPGTHDSDAAAAGGQAASASPLEKLLKNGETFLRLDNFAEAEEVYKRATNEYPEDYRGWWGLIICSTHNLGSVSEQQKQVDTWYGYVKTLAPEAVLRGLEPRYVEYLKLVAWKDAQSALTGTRSLKQSLQDKIAHWQDADRQEELNDKEQEAKYERELQRIRDARQGEISRCEAVAAEAEKQCGQWRMLIIGYIAFVACLFIWMCSMMSSAPNGVSQLGLFCIVFLVLSCVFYLQYRMRKNNAYEKQNALNNARNALHNEELKLQQTHQQLQQKQQQTHQQEAEQRKRGIEDAEQQIRECDLYLGNSPEVVQCFFHSIRCEKIGVTVQAPEKASISNADWEANIKFSRHWYESDGNN